MYPYLLNNLEIKKPNQVWAADITYIRLVGGFCYLIAIIDWYSRYILSWKISNSMDIWFCLEALEEALNIYPYPTIFNTDQGSQFTSIKFTQNLLEKHTQISMNGRGRCLDNIIIERFFRSLKYEDIYLKEYESVKDVKEGCKNYMLFYNTQRKHSSLNYQTPFEVFSRN